MNNPAPGEPLEKSYLCRVWGRLTDWEKSPVYRMIISMRIRSLLKRMGSDGGALAALARIGKPAVPALIWALENGDAHTRKSASGKLGKIGDVSAVPALIVSLGNKDGGVRWYATRALEKLEPESRDDIKLLRIAARKARAEGNHTGGFTKVYRKWSGIMNERAREGTGVKRIRVPSKPGTPRGTRRMLSMDRVSG